MMIKTKIYYYFLIGFFFTLPIFGQETLIVSGKVLSNEDSLPIPGVTVAVEGTSNGTVTDFDGKFTLNVLPDAVLIFSYVGFTTKEINVNGRTNIDVVLDEDTNALDEVVVIGYGSQKRGDLTGSVSSISASEMEQSRVPSFQEAIQGRLAGVRVSSSSGEPGAAIDISIRGSNTIYGSSAPLYVIDGVPYDVNTAEVAGASIGNGNNSNPLATLNPSSIESVEILKDASATAIYGARGANGVVLITTKSGKPGKMQISYDGNVGFGSVIRELPVLSAERYLDYRLALDPDTFLFYTDSNEDGLFNSLDDQRDPYQLPMHNWQDEMLRTGVTQNHNISLSGGNDTGTTFSGGLGFLDQQAIIRNNDYQRYTMRLNLDHKHNDKLKMGLNFDMGYSELGGATQSGGGAGIFNGIVQNLVISRPLEFFAPGWDTEGRYINPLSMLDDAYKNVSLLRNNLSAYIEYNLAKDLSVNVSGGGFLSSSKGKEFYGKFTNWGNIDNGRAMLQESRAYSWNFVTRLNYQKRINEDHYFDAMMAFEMNHYNWERFFLETSDFADESTGIDDISKGARIKGVNSDRNVNNRISYFGRLNYHFTDRHLFTATFRADGSDKFGPNNRFGFFPSFAYAWQIIKEPFLTSQEVISNMKLRTSYGITGNDRIPAYSYLSRMNNATYGGELGIAPESLSNYDLKWETTSQVNLGLDMGLFDNRIEFNLDVYKKQTTDMLLPAYVPTRTGFRQQWQNLGRVDNEGIEFQISTLNIDKNDFSWSTNFNISSNRNKVVDLGDVDFIPVNIGGGWITQVGRVSEGDALGRAYGYVFDGVYQIEDFTWQNDNDPNINHQERNYQLREGIVGVSGIDVQPGSFKFRDLNNDGVIDLENDRTAISRSFPKHFGGINNSFRYKNFDLSVLFNWSYGNEIFNESLYRLQGGVSHTFMNIDSDFFDNRWTPENPTNEYGTFADWNETSLPASSYYVEDASWLRLQNINLGYNLPQELAKKGGFDRIRVYFSGTNLYTWTKYSGFDPEIDSGNPLLPGFDRLTYPRTKTYAIGANLTF